MARAPAARVRLLPRLGVLLVAVGAFSRIGILVMAVIFAAPDSDSPSISAYNLLIGIAFTLLTAVSFALPLLGMHRRLDTEKAQLLDGVHIRLRSVLGRIHGSVDSDDLSRADAFQKMQAALLAERDLYARLST